MTILTTTHDTQQLLLLPLPGGQSDVAAATAAAPKFNVVHWPLFANQHTHTRTNEHTHSRRTADKAEVTSDAELFLLQRTAHINRMHLCVSVCESLSVSVYVCVCVRFIGSTLTSSVLPGISSAAAKFRRLQVESDRINF